MANKKLANIIGEKCVGRNITLACAESITAGGISSALTSVSGSSQWFEFGFVTYSDRAKSDLLGIGDVVERFGAVSRQTALAMAIAARSRSGADVAVAVTGIAGPTGADDKNPVGTVYGAIVSSDNNKELHWTFKGSRTKVREQTVSEVLQQLAEFLD